MNRSGIRDRVSRADLRSMEGGQGLVRDVQTIMIVDPPFSHKSSDQPSTLHVTSVHDHAQHMPYEDTATMLSRML
jgi:hypothetical protein